MSLPTHVDAQLQRERQSDVSGPAITQDEADAIVSVFDLDDVECILVHWVDGFLGPRPLLQPVHYGREEWLT